MATLSGITRDAGGAPMPGATVRVFDSASHALIATVISDQNGGWSAAVPYPGPYYATGYKTGAPDIAGITSNVLNPNPVYGSVTRGTLTAQAFATAASTQSMNYTVSAANEELVVAVGGPNVDSITAVTYGGVPMTARGTQLGTGCGVRLYTLANPAVGTAAIAVTYPGASKCTITATTVSVDADPTPFATELISGAGVTQLTDTINVPRSGARVLVFANISAIITTGTALNGATSFLQTSPAGGTTGLGSSYSAQKLGTGTDPASGYGISWGSSANGAMIGVCFTPKPT